MQTLAGGSPVRRFLAPDDGGAHSTEPTAATPTFRGNSFATADGGETLYCNDDRMLVRQAQERGSDQYSVSRTTLEDVYLGLIQGAGE